MSRLEQAAQNAVEIRNLTKKFGSVTVIDDVSFTVKRGETVTLLGPSGCGKTTTLRCIAGLEEPTSGFIQIGDTLAFDGKANFELEPEKRNVGMVFQSYAIWPHMTVGENVRFPLDIKKLPQKERRDRVAEILKSVGLGDYVDRPASQLSGGQQQRVALARALVFEPSVVLFDEPLSNLDANLRDHMRNELQDLQARIGFTAIYVTHDQREALSLSDEVIVMNGGKIDQIGPPEEVFAHPKTVFTARFLGCSNIFKGRMSASQEHGRLSISVAPEMTFSGRHHGDEPSIGTEMAVVIRSNKIRICQSQGVAEAGAQHFAGLVESKVFFGSYVEYGLRIGGLHVKADCDVGTPYNVGENVFVAIHPSDCLVVRV
ncbi:MAG: transporter ATP-binding protein [Pseudomonadota bacterium]|jgi:iron(III) transport system ATP-binding protein